MSQRFHRLVEKWRRFRKRPADERALILRAMILLPITEIGLRVLGFRQCKEKIENLLVSHPQSQASQSDIPIETAAANPTRLASEAFAGGVFSLLAMFVAIDASAI